MNSPIHSAGVLHESVFMTQDSSAPRRVLIQIPIEEINCPYCPLIYRLRIKESDLDSTWPGRAKPFS